MEGAELLVNIGLGAHRLAGRGATHDMTGKIRGSIVVSISACHAEDPGSIPGRGVI